MEVVLRPDGMSRFTFFVFFLEKEIGAACGGVKMVLGVL